VSRPTTLKLYPSLLTEKQVNGILGAMKYKVTLVESEEGVAVWCEDLPGCVSQGETKSEALSNIHIAIKEYLDAIPVVEATFKTKVSREEVAV